MLPFSWLDFFIIITVWDTSSNYQTNKNDSTVYRLQVNAETPPFEGKTLKSPLLIDPSLDEYHELMTRTNTFQDQDQLGLLLQELQPPTAYPKFCLPATVATVATL